METNTISALDFYRHARDIAEGPDFSNEKLLHAVELFEQAIKFDTSFAVAFTDLCLAHLKLYNFGFDRTQSRLEKAKQALDTSLQMQPELPEAHLAQAYYYYWGLKEYDAALPEFEMAAKHLPENSWVLSGSAFILRRRGNFTEAAERLEKILQLKPHEPVIARELGITYLVLRKYEQADHYFDYSISLVPINIDSYIWKGWNHLLWDGDANKVRELLGSVPESKNPGSLWLLVYASLLERNYEAALELLRDESMDYVPRTLYIAWVHHLQGLHEESRAAFATVCRILEKLTEQHPEMHYTHSSLGIVYAALGRKEEAIREAKLGTKLYPVSTDALDGPLFVLNLVYTNILVGDLEAALDQIEYLLSIPCRLSLSMLRLDPRFDPLRNDVRFKKLLEGRSGL